MPALDVNPKALMYIEKRLRMSVNPLGFALLYGAVLTVVALSIMISQLHGAGTPLTLGKMTLAVTCMLLLFGAFAWFLRCMAISGSWLNFERIEGTYNTGSKREAWDELMRRFRIHAEVIQSSRCRRLLRELCSYATSMELRNRDQQELVDRLLAAVAAADVRLAGSTEKTSTAMWGKRIVIIGLVVILLRAIAGLLSLWHL